MAFSMIFLCYGACGASGLVGLIKFHFVVLFENSRVPGIITIVVFDANEMGFGFLTAVQFTVGL